MVWRSAEGDLSRHARIVRELIDMPVDVIVAFSEGVDAAAAATRTIPIVMGGYVYPVERGLVQSLARPGRNITGLSITSERNDVQKQLALLKEAAPGITKVVLISRSAGSSADNTADPRTQLRFDEAARALRLDLMHLTYGDPATIGAVLRSAARQGANAVMLDGNFSLHQHGNQRRLDEEALRLRLPVMTSWLPAVAHGTLIAHGPDQTVRWRRIPHFIDRILKGEKPENLAIEQLGNPELHINLKTAKTLGLELPLSLLRRADRVFE